MPSCSCVDATAAHSYSLGRSTIDKLSDDVLLCVFDSYRLESEEEEEREHTWSWDVLVHTCRRWRNIVFGHPGHLKLRLVCKSKTDMNAALDIWPALPIVVNADIGDDVDEDDTFGALEHRDRIVGISLSLWTLTQSRVDKCLRVMQQAFPVLTFLVIHMEHGGKVPHVNTDAFLGGSVPRLERFSSMGIRIPALTTLLSSATELVDLNLDDLPAEHISPEAMSTCLSSLTRLRSLYIYFQSWPSFIYSTSRSQRPPPSTPTVFPALTKLFLGGPPEYLEELLTRMDTPQLKYGRLQFSDEANFDPPGVSQFIHRTGMFNLPTEVEVYIGKAGFFRLLSSIDPVKMIHLSFSGSDSDLDLSTEVVLMKEFFTGCPPLSRIERLKLAEDDLDVRYSCSHTAPWLELLQPFTAVQTLHLSGEVILPHVSRTLGMLAGERATEVLPALHTLVLSWTRELVSEAVRVVEPFIVARKHSGHPVVVERTSPWIDDPDSSDA